MTADTNVFVYGFDPQDSLKNTVGRFVVERMARTRSPVALQVVGELQNVLRRKLRFEPKAAAAAARDVLLTYKIFPPSLEASHAALTYVESGRLSYWDALMLASAAEAGCTVMLAEDLQHGATLFGLEIVNPFAAEGISPRAAQLLDLA